MTEPTVTIPARTAWAASRYLHHVSDFWPTVDGDKMRKISFDLQTAISQSCSMEDLNFIFVAARLEESL